MHKIIILLFLSLLSNVAAAQTAPLDTAALSHWPDNNPEPLMSENGRFMVYFRSNGQGEAKSHQQTFLMKLREKMPVEIDALPSQINFSQDSRFLVYLNAGQRLNILNLATGNSERIEGIGSFKVFKNRIYYFSLQSKYTLHIREIGSGEEKKFANISSILLSRTLDAAFFIRQAARGVELLAERSGGKCPCLWKGEQIGSFLQDRASGSLYFNGRVDGRQSLYFLQGNNKVRSLPAPVPANYAQHYQLGRAVMTTPDGKNLVYSLEQKEKPVGKEKPAPLLNVWSFQDVRPRDYYQPTGGKKQEPKMLMNLSSGRCLLLSDNTQQLSGLANRYAWTVHQGGEGYEQEADWNRYSLFKPWVQNLEAGAAKLPAPRLNYLSQDGDFNLFLDEEKSVLVLQNLKTGKQRSLPEIPVSFFTDNRSGLQFATFEQANQVMWSQRGAWVLFNDGYDIWQVGLNTKAVPLCLTSGEGRAQGIHFTIVDGQMAMRSKDTLLIKGVREKDMSTGFYTCSLSHAGSIKLLYEDNARYEMLACKAGCFLFRVSTAEHSPYFAWSVDLKNFDTYLDLRPESDYNWLEAKLYHFRGLGGQQLKGILYKPKNFDASKKYPLILYYYQELGSQQLHDYLHPAYFPGTLNIPWMVSRGYLVFVPEVKNEYNHNGKSAFDCIQGAGNFLKTLSFVDSSKIGLSGHSFGGFETLYMITHSHDYAAAYAGSPFAELISKYNAVPGFFNNGQTAIGPTPWENLELFLENSPFYRLDQVQTPLLLMGNKGDFLWPQAPMFFKGMRRLGKPCWMLEYLNQGHTLQGPAVVDFTIKTQEFFDHYLKGLPPPEWMLQHPSVKSANQDLSQGILTPEAQQKAKALLIKQRQIQ